MLKIYIVEDDEDIREVVKYALCSAGFEVTGFESSLEFYKAMNDSSPALVLLDIMLPGDDGLDILKKLRSSNNTKKLPVIMLTAKGSELDKVKGLDFGADDYVTKPFGVMELVSRVNAVLRRSGVENEPDKKLEYGGITIDNTRRTVTVDGEPIILTFKEYELLHYLMLNKGLALDRSKILETVWGYDFEGESRTLDMHIRSLRQKLGMLAQNIKTIRNVGYKFGE
ncbi:MAG: response regulator transcription factor [Oscillospiraceae bacterium]|nr:response regulator transcription factor [Oscillospiraceae bacterium]